jgi:type I restriction enzyme, S subunit
MQRRLSIIDEINDAIRANLARSIRLRQAVLQRAFEGKLVPQDPNDEPASVLLARIRAERAAEPERTGWGRKPRAARGRLQPEATPGGRDDG